MSDKDSINLARFVNTGKVLIGSAYQQRKAYMTYEEELLQSALLGIQPRPGLIDVIKKVFRKDNHDYK